MFTEKVRNVLALILFALQLVSLVNFFLSKTANQLIFSLFSFFIFGALGTFCLILNAKQIEDHL
jgi:FtsH-binding integral membrane protein